MRTSIVHGSELAQDAKPTASRLTKALRARFRLLPKQCERWDWMKICCVKITSSVPTIATTIMPTIGVMMLTIVCRVCELGVITSRHRRRHVSPLQNEGEDDDRAPSGVTCR